MRRLNRFVLCKLEVLKLEHSCFGRYYAPALGFLMFAVGLNFSLKDFGKAFEQPGVLAIGFFCQYMVKPLLGVVFAAISVSILHLPEAVGMSFLKHFLFKIIFFQYSSYISTFGTWYTMYSCLSNTKDCHGSSTFVCRIRIDLGSLFKWSSTVKLCNIPGRTCVCTPQYCHDSSVNSCSCGRHSTADTVTTRAAVAHWSGRHDSQHYRNCGCAYCSRSFPQQVKYTNLGREFFHLWLPFIDDVPLSLITGCWMNIR